jgi:para-nitrobenzyl esterase
MKRRMRGWLIALGMLILLLGSLAYYGVGALRPPTASAAAAIRTTLGVIQGTSEAGLTVYRGIPYASPPVGELRWRPPAPAFWKGTLEATHFKPACVQIGGALPGSPAEKMSEDCLGLNIWTPANEGSKKLAVMVFLYGGHFTNGSSAPRLYWGDSLARKGVVVVTFNYRLGVLGFLAHPDLSAESPQHVSGNYALLDSIAALIWVKSNIAAFGGDAANITLFGQSAGAYLASELMASPLAKGLFIRVIGMSGADMGAAGSPGDMPLKAQAEANGVAFAESLGATSLASLRLLPAQTLAARGSESQIPGLDLPNIDGYVLPQEVHASLATRADAANIDLMVGIDAQEGATMVGTPMHVNAYTAMVRTRYGALADRILAHFPARSDVEAASNQARLATADVAWRTFTWGRIHDEHRGARTYGYVFSRVPPWPPFATLHAAGHGAELPYVFGFPPRLAFFASTWPWKAWRDSAIAGEIQSYWTNFAKTGDPNGNALPTWSQLGASDSILDFSDSTHMAGLPDRPAFSLMDAHWRELRRNPSAARRLIAPGTEAIPQLSSGT